jgi:AcrR family transcriptional regulator
LADEPKETLCDAQASRGGRPTRDEAERIGQRILDMATAMFLAQGYEATSVEAVAQRLRISKRTFYHRYRSKADLFAAVVHQIIAHLRPADIAPLFVGGTLEQILVRLAKLALQAALTDEAVALQRLVIAEAARFPELAAVVLGEGSRREAIDAIGQLLQRHGVGIDDAPFAAEQFLQMVVSSPLRRSLGLGSPMTAKERDAWAERTVALFLRGCPGPVMTEPQRRRETSA